MSNDAETSASNATKDASAAGSVSKSATKIGSLDPFSQSLIGSIPSMPAGRVGQKKAIDVYFSLLTEQKSEVFCDIGANKGEAGRRALATRPEMKVFGFEANPKIHNLYRDINIDAGVNWVNFAIAHQPGALTLYVPKVLSRTLKGETLVTRRVIEAEGTGKSSLLQRDETAEYEAVSVPAVTLDAFLHENAPDGRVALWIDVEGAASLVLQGALETLSRTDLIIIEVEGFAFWQNQALVRQVLDLLRDHGFAPILRDREYHDAQFNVICLREDPDLAAKQQWIGRRIDEGQGKPEPLSSLQQSVTPATTPVLVPCFNNPTYAGNMLAQLQAVGFEDITFVDNASDNPAMLVWLEQASQSGAKVERLSENFGPLASIFTEQRLASLPRWFCVTDPDLQFNVALPPDFLQTLVDTLERHGHAKAGFALNIANQRALRTDKFVIDRSSCHIWEWEQQFWKNRLDFTAGGDPVFEAAIDTTFALYDKTLFKASQFLKALRLGGRFTAEHLPWLAHPTMPEYEATHYRARQKFSYYVR